MKSFFIVFLMVFSAAQASAQVVAGSEPVTAAVVPSGLNGLWKLYGWPCGDIANEAVVRVDHHESLLAVTLLESACEKDHYYVNKIYMTGWLDQSTNQILFQRVVYNARDGSPSDSKIRIGKVYQQEQLIMMYQARYPDRRYLMVRSAQK